VILLTRWYPVDSLIALAIAVLIAKGAWDILRETVDILMEAAPSDLNVPQMMRVSAVQDVHDLHFWSIAGGMPVLTAHVQVAEDRTLTACEEIRVELNQLLMRNYGMAHTTIQFECVGCDPNHLYCELHPSGVSGVAEGSHVPNSG
jgi:cobalt-zinc-cadmium efflux system protein